MALEGGIQGKSRCLSAETCGEQLLPGIPDEITLDQITPRLPWRSFHSLSSVSRPWLHAIRSHEVYSARTRLHSTETLILVNYFRPGNLHVIGLYSMGDGSVCELPAIPRLRRGIPWFCRCVSLNGKVYVLGGAEESSRDHGSTSRVYVMDLAGQRRWKKCARMKEPRSMFGCAVMDGKIYVFGGLPDTRESEVYDPEKDEWSSITPMMNDRAGHRVETVGEELVLHGGRVRYLGALRRQSANFLDFYHPGRDEWRRVEPFGRRRERMFLAKGKFHSMSWHGSPEISVHDAETNSWKPVHSFCVTEIGLEGYKPRAILAVNGQLLARVEPRTSWNGPVSSNLVQCGGLGGKNMKIVWERKAGFSAPQFFIHTLVILYPIQL